MKKIEAFIRHEAFEPIRMELLEKGFPSLSVGQYRGSGRQKGITEHYRGSELVIHLRPKMKLEIVVDDKDVGLVKETILRHARTGEVGDGKIFVLPVEEAIRIRNRRGRRRGASGTRIRRDPGRACRRNAAGEVSSAPPKAEGVRAAGALVAATTDSRRNFSEMATIDRAATTRRTEQGGRARACRGARHPVHPAVVHRHPRPAEELRCRPEGARGRARGGNGLRRLVDHRASTGSRSRT